MFRRNLCMVDAMLVTQIADEEIETLSHYLLGFKSLRGNRNLKSGNDVKDTPARKTISHFIDCVIKELPFLRDRYDENLLYTEHFEDPHGMLKSLASHVHNYLFYGRRFFVVSNAKHEQVKIDLPSLEGEYPRYPVSNIPLINYSCV